MKHSNGIPLCNLELNKKAKVIDLKCSENELRRFLDLGIVKDTILTPIFKSPFGTPTAYEVRKTVLALRKETAEKIIVSEAE